MADFSFRGSVSSSKSIMNRTLIVQSFEDDINIIGESRCDDVLLMKNALKRFADGERSFDCGHAGTVLRFLALRLSREPGEWMLLGSSRLLSRPQAGLFKILDQLGVTHHLTPAGLVLQSKGWRPTDRLVVDGGESSQFLSSLVLSAWNLPWDLRISLEGNLVSRAYFSLTEYIVKSFGMTLLNEGSEWLLAGNKRPKKISFVAEPDMSSCFALAACAIFAGSCAIENFPRESVQPDIIFRDFLKMMNVEWLHEGRELRVRKSEDLRPLAVNVNNTPDVVPVLTVLLARANGTSRLTGFEHLVHKESNRLEQVQKLLTRLGRRCEIVDKEFLIHGEAHSFAAIGDFDPDKDHRMAMAAQVANFGGARFEILHKDVVKKSFPEFWQIVEGR